MSYVADLHVHSRFAYACSKNLTLEGLAEWAKLKGIDVLASGDFTHPVWNGELREKLEEVSPGLFSYDDVNFVLGTEISCVYKQDCRGRRLHLLVFAPGFGAVDRLRRSLADVGAKLDGDGRPSVRLSGRDLTALVLDIDPSCMVIPAHVWTPWYGLFGSKSGFDSLEDCFQDMSPFIHAVETGLSSDPKMNWPVSELEGKSIVSFSDAHSLPNLGRELTVFGGHPGYNSLVRALANQDVDYTIEFYAEEGKYHYSGHRKCGVRQSPEETLRQGGRCPVCGRALTLGVLHRVESLAGGKVAGSVDGDGYVRSGDRPPFIRAVSLVNIISQALGKGSNTQAVQREYRRIVGELGSEVHALIHAGAADLELAGGERIAEGVLLARSGKVRVEPGFDGEYGKVRVWEAA